MPQLANAVDPQSARDSGQQLRSQPSPSNEPRASFDRMKAAYRRNSNPTYAERIASLDKMIALVRDNQDRIAQAISQDFSHRSPHETKLAEILMMVAAMKEIRSNLKSWMKPKARHVAFTLKPARAQVIYQPLGVVGVIAPWNYSVQLALVPAATALAAGNRVMIKPSEITPKTSELMQQLIAEAFPADLCTVITGGVQTAQAFCELPFDHLLYTGSTQIGKLVMAAAAKNLTPVTLELGGKSPTIVHESFPLEVAAERIAFGKWLNCGQTCIAPDYLLVPESKRDEMVSVLTGIVRKMYPTVRDNPDYSAVVSANHHQRILGYVQDAVARGAKKVEIKPDGESFESGTRKIAPTLLLDVKDDMTVMQEEIFGPVLPIVTYRTLDEAIEYVNDRPRPLALFYFDRDAERVKSVLERTVSGGVSVNDTGTHFAVESLPFGGVGPSGMGAYHGFEGFETFSHKKGVLLQSRFNSAGMVAPPFGPKIERLLKFLIGK